MLSLSLFSSSILVLSSLLAHTISATSIARQSESELREYYTRFHSLGTDYNFDSREWQSVNASDMSYKYERAVPRIRGRDSKSSKNSKGKLTSLSKVFQYFKGIGKQEKVKITWYEGNDLLNPSCWANTDWAPSDNSFACALTLHGWLSRPECFKFIELCNGPEKCIFVRVVDSCAGCAPGSKHVDLTKGAFSQLADPDVGVLNVMMRQATDPAIWMEELWGPQH